MLPRPMHEYDLEEIKREIVESRSLTIKTNNLVNALAADLKSIAKRQQGYERQEGQDEDPAGDLQVREGPNE